MGIEIFIDGRKVDTDERSVVSVTLSVASVTEVESSRTGYSKTIVLPATTLNAGIMGDCADVNSAEMFNSAEHTARIEADGFTVMEGLAYLNNTRSDAGSGGHYSINIVGHGKRWVGHALTTPLKALDVPFSEVISGSVIRDSWRWSKPVRFLPVQRESDENTAGGGKLFSALKVMTSDDYSPFLHVKSLVEKLYAEAGYEIESGFMSEELFGSLYMSGAYATGDESRLKERMDFRAGRFAAAQTTANHLGRVYASPYMGGNTVGNIVDTANPLEQSEGIRLPDVYTAGDYFRKEDGRIMFKPPQEVSVAFEYSVHYTTDYYMESRTRLRGFDRIKVDAEQERVYTLANRNEERRTDIKGGKTFMLIVFEHNEGDSYRLEYDEVVNPDADPENPAPADMVTRVHSTFSSRVSYLTFNTSNRVLNPVLKRSPAGSSAYVLCEKDWAMYDGYVTERGEVDVEVVVKSAPEKVSPGSPKYFDLVYFGGAEQGMKFRIGNGTVLRPLFSARPGEGSRVDYEDVMAHGMSCMDLISALRHMFNLHFYTDELAGKVFIEPRDRFYSDTVVVDWSDRTDLSKPVTVSEPGGDMARTLKFCYAPGDKAVAGYNMANGGSIGSWSAAIVNKRAKRAEISFVNPVFSPAISEQGLVTQAPAAWLLRTDDQTVKIVRYMGMAELPQGEIWGWPSAEQEYPLAAFHYPGATLCFGDSGSLVGLHSFYDGNIDVYNNGKRAELYLRLYPEDVEPFIVPNRLGRDFRARFRLKINGESALFRLEQICDYNPASGSPTRCIFVKEV